MTRIIFVGLLLLTQVGQATSQSESEICRRLFVSAGDIAREAKVGLDLAAQAVWGASEMNGNTLTLTGTLTQTNPVLDTWSYSGVPSDRMIIQFSGATPIEIAFASFDGWLQGTWEDFTNSHRVDFTMKVGTDYDIRIQSESLPDNVDPKYTWQRQLTGTLPYEETPTTANLLHSGTTTYELSSGYAYYHYQEACTGTSSNSTTSTTVNDQYFATIRHNSSQGVYAVNKGIMSNSSASVGGNTYAYHDAMVQWAAYTNFPDSASSGIYNKVLDANYWQASGSMTKNGTAFGTVAFDRPVIADTDGPLLVLNVSSGPSYLLHPLLQPAVTAVGPDPAASPHEFTLFENYPNPFNPVTRIPFELATASSVSLEIYDGLGRRVAELVHDHLLRGRHIVQWDASDFPSGVYWSRLEVAGNAATRKLVLVK